MIVDRSLAIRIDGLFQPTGGTKPGRPASRTQTDLTMKRDIRRHLPENGMRRRPTDAGKAMPLNDVSVKNCASHFNHELILRRPYFKDKIVDMTQRQTRVGIAGQPHTDEDDGAQHID